MSDKDRASPNLIESTGLKSLLGKDNYPLIGGTGTNGKLILQFSNITKLKRKQGKIKTTLCTVIF